MIARQIAKDAISIYGMRVVPDQVRGHFPVTRNRKTRLTAERARRAGCMNPGSSNFFGPAQTGLLSILILVDGELLEPREAGSSRWRQLAARG